MKKIVLGLLTIFLFIGTGCDDFLDVDQPDIVESETAFQSYNEGLVTVIGCYQGLQEAVGQLFLLANLRSDLMLTNETAPAYFRELNDGICSSENPFTDPSPFYKVINQSNDVLDNLDRLMANDPGNFTEAVKNKFAAEVTVVRALAYLYVIQNYKEVYYYEESLTEYDPDYKLSPTPKEEVLTKLVSQIEYYLFEKNVGEFVTPNQVDGDKRWYKFRFGEKESVYQLLGELYLEMKDYLKAFEYFHRIVDVPGGSADKYSMSDKFGLGSWEKIFESYAKSFKTEDEILLTVPFFKQHNQVHNIQYWSSAGNDGVYYVKPSPVCITYFESQGESGDFYRGTSASYGFEGERPYVRKYIVNSDPYDNDNSFPLFRAADSWMDAAEALNHMGNPGAALELINSGIYNGEIIKGVSKGVRGRVNLKPIDIEDYEPIRSKLELGEAITLEDSIRSADMALLSERAREQAFEVSRFYDIRRVAEYWNDPTIMASIISSKYINVDEAKKEIVYQRYLNTDNWFIGN